MPYELTGTLKEVMPAREFASGFRKQEFVVTAADNPKYPQDIKLECHKDKCDTLSGLTPGTPVLIAFDLRGNEYQGKYYISLVAFRVGLAAAARRDPVDQRPAIEPGDAGQDTDDGLPF